MPTPAPSHPARSAAHLSSIPGVWRALSGMPTAGVSAAVSSGYSALDAELPAGGWPHGLVELLSDQPGLTDATLLAPMWRLTAPAARPPGSHPPRTEPWVAWVVPDRLAWVPHAPGWQRLGLKLSQLLWVRTTSAADAVWTIEQMLRGPAVSSVVWVAPQVQPQQLRRVHWAARSAGVPVFAARPLACRSDPSPAPLRLLLRPVATPCAKRQTPDESGLEVEILKRSGPMLEAPVYLPHGAPLHLLPPASIQPGRAPVVRAPETRDAVDRPVPAPLAP